MNYSRLVYLFLLSVSFQFLVAQTDCTRYFFDGDDDVITLPKELNDQLGAGAFTIEMWIQGDEESEQSNNPTLLSNRSPQQGLAFYFKEKTNASDGKILAVSFNGQEYYDDDCPIILDGTCHFVAVKRFVDRLYFYLDGDQIYQIPIPTDLGFQSTLPLTVGHDQVDFFGSRFQGYIDELKIWSVPLSAIVIKQQYYRELLFEEAGILAQYRFAESEGVEFLDDSGNSYNGFLGDGESENSEPIRSASCCQGMVDVKEQSFTSYLVYPNPASSSIQVQNFSKSSGSSSGFLEIQVMNLNGNIVLKDEVSTLAIDVDISSLQPGVYLMKISDSISVNWLKFIKI